MCVHIPLIRHIINSVHHMCTDMDLSDDAVQHDALGATGRDLSFLPQGDAMEEEEVVDSAQDSGPEIEEAEQNEQPQWREVIGEITVTGSEYLA